MVTRARPAPNASNSITVAGKNIYLSNKELLAEIKKCREKGQMSDVLAKMLQLLCSRYAKKGSYVSYSYNEDMQAYAMMMLVRTWQGFNPEKSENPFAFFTQCIKHSFIQYLNVEKRHRDIRDKLQIDAGLNPSYGYDAEGNRMGGGGIEDDQDFEILKRVANDLAKNTYVDAPIERDSKGEEIVVDIPEQDSDSVEII